MGKNIFVSYKYADSDVRTIDGKRFPTVRDYVDSLAAKIGDTGNFYYGEGSDEDLSYLSEDSIYERLKDRLFHTSVTIVLLSPNMKEPNRRDRTQWIPWEIYYSLRKKTRDERTSQRNSIIAVALPDRAGKYDHAIINKDCCDSPCREIQTYSMFNILRYNMFNLKNRNGRKCDDGSTVYHGPVSYIHLVKWDDFIENINVHIAIAEDRKAHIEDYEMHIDVNV